MSWELLTTQHFNFCIIFITIFGAIIGSFLNVVIYRYPIQLMQEWNNACRMQLNQPLLETNEKFNLSFPRSHCTSCKKIIPFWFNIPIFSYLFLLGKCRYCRAPISCQYILVEIISAVLTVIVFMHFGISLIATEFLIFTYGLIVASFIDFNHQFLPDTITYILLWLGLITATQHYFTDPLQAIYGVIFGYLFLWAIAKGFIILRKKEGMGLGDCKLFATIGAWVGATALPNVLLISALLGLIISGILLLFKKINRNNPIPFGPYIATSGWVCVVYGNQLNAWMIQWIH